MANVIIKKATTDEELQTYNKMEQYAFAPSPRRAAADEKGPQGTDYYKTSIRYLLYEDDIAVSSLHSIPMTENVRGKIFEMQGIAGVTTYPETRRKGYVKKLMQHALQEGKDQGKVFSTLYPFRQSFYGKFGYINFPHSRLVKLNPAHLKDIKHFEIHGDIERHLVGDQIDRYYDFITKMQKDRHGMALFIREKDQSFEKSKNWIVFAVVNGEDRGLMFISTTGFEKEMKIGFFSYLDANAKYLLIDHLSRHIDQFSEIQIRLFADERPETWLYDTKMHIQSRDWVPSAMGRVLDVAAMEGFQVGIGEVSIKLADEHCEWNNKTWKLSSTDSELKVEETSTHDIKMTIQGLSALVYGGYELEDMILRGWIGPSINKNELLQLFTPQTPFLFSTF